MRRNYGMAAEEAAALFLEEKGIRILERNFRSYHGEIDIIGSKDEKKQRMWYSGGSS